MSLPTEACARRVQASGGGLRSTFAASQLRWTPPWACPPKLAPGDSASKRRWLEVHLRCFAATVDTSMGLPTEACARRQCKQAQVASGPPSLLRSYGGHLHALA